jgi:hypothetical protein
MDILKAGGLYFVLVFSVGWLFGPIRELWLTPLIGRSSAVLLEAPLMVIVMIAAARWVIRHGRVSAALRIRASMGVVALGMLMVAELSGARWVREQSISEHVASLATMPGGISLGMFLLFAAMPMLIHRSEVSTSVH